MINNPVAAPAAAYVVVEHILGPDYFVHNRPPSPACGADQGDGPGVRVQITSHYDRIPTQWDLRTGEWEQVRDEIIRSKAKVSARLLQTW